MNLVTYGLGAECASCLSRFGFDGLISFGVRGGGETFLSIVSIMDFQSDKDHTK